MSCPPLFSQLSLATWAAWEPLCPWPAALLNEQGKILAATPAFFKILPAHLKPRNLFTLMDEDEQAKTLKLWAASKTRPATAPAEMTLTFQEKEHPRYLKLTYTYLPDGHILATAEDVSERVLAEKAKLGAAKTPLALLAALPVLLNPQFSTTLQQVIPTLHHNPALQESLNTLATQLQNAYHQAYASESQVDLHAILKQCIYHFASANQKDAWQIKANLNAKNFKRKALPIAAEQVFTQLLNEVKALVPPNGHPQITLTSANLTDDEKVWQLTVVLNHPATNQTESRPNLLAPWPSLLQGTSHWQQGPQQATWQITLPLTAQTPAVPPSSAHQLKGRVLAVDDEEYIRIILQEMLTDQGLLVETATNGQEALNKVKQENFDLIFTDIKMPVMDGIELINCLRNLPDFKSKIIVITGNFQEELFQKNPHNIQAKIDGFINKPFWPEHITDILEYYLRPKI